MSDDTTAAPETDDGSLLETGDEPVVRLVRWSPTPNPGSPDESYRQSVAGSALADPVATLVAAGRNLNIPVGALARHVLAEWASAGASALLAAGPDPVAELVEAARAVDEAPQGYARDEAWHALKGRIEWLAHGLENPEATYPGGGAGPTRRRRVGAYGLAVARGSVLLCRVSDGYPGAGRWTLPGGGLEHGEDPLEGLVREFHEETGMVATPGEFLISDSHHLQRSDVDLHLLRLIWRVEVPTHVEPRVIEVDGSTAEAAWIDPERLRRIPLLSVASKAVAAAGLDAPTPDRSDGAV